MLTASSMPPLPMLLLLLQLALTLLAASDAEEFPYRLRLDKDSELAWNFNEREDLIAFGLRVPAESRILGIGFNERGSLAGADFALVTFDSDGNAAIGDFSTDKRRRLRRLKSRRYRLADSTVSNGRRSLVLVRRIDAGKDGGYSIDRGTTHLLFFKSQFLWPRLSDYDVSSHPVQLIRSRQVVPPPAPDTFEMEVRVDKVQVPASETTYWCRVAQLPRMAEKHHIVGYEPIITPSSSNIVHHMEVFLCLEGIDKSVRHYNAPCNSETKPQGLTSCRKVIGAWAMGSEGIFFPEEAGLPIGGEDLQQQLVVVEIHYNNEKAEAGIVDSSGIRFFVSPRLRQHDVGILELGLDYLANGAVPPGQRAFELTGFCQPECTEVALPPSGISIFASQLHTHTMGFRVITRQIHQDGSVSILNEDRHYDPTFQEIRLLPRPVKVRPGDALVTTCTYDSRDRRNVTLGGISISNEMCLNYVFYYPKTNLELCKSVASDKELGEYFQRMRWLFGSPTSAQQSIEANFLSIGWGLAEALELQRVFWHGGIAESCNTSAGKLFEGHQWSNMKPVSVEFH